MTNTTKRIATIAIALAGSACAGQDGETGSTSADVVTWTASQIAYTPSSGNTGTTVQSGLDQTATRVSTLEARAPVPGPEGPAGPQGPAGPTGATGPIGPAGADGAIGPQGPTGATGATGPIGPMGPMGIAGPPGPIGAIGATGPAGAQGPAGAPGPIGPAGPKGDVGPAGPSSPPDVYYAPTRGSLLDLGVAGTYAYFDIDQPGTYLVRARVLAASFGDSYHVAECHFYNRASDHVVLQAPNDVGQYIQASTTELETVVDLSDASPSNPIFVGVECNQLDGWDQIGFDASLTAMKINRVPSAS